MDDWHDLPLVRSCVRVGNVSGTSEEPAQQSVWLLEVAGGNERSSEKPSTPMLCAEEEMAISFSSFALLLHTRAHMSCRRFL